MKVSSSEMFFPWKGKNGQIIPESWPDLLLYAFERECAIKANNLVTKILRCDEKMTQFSYCDHCIVDLRFYGNLRANYCVFQKLIEIFIFLKKLPFFDHQFEIILPISSFLLLSSLLYWFFSLNEITTVPSLFSLHVLPEGTVPFFLNPHILCHKLT